MTRGSGCRSALTKRVFTTPGWPPHLDTFAANWSRTEFASHVQRQGLAIVTAETFSVEDSPLHAIRVSLGAASSRSELARALGILAAALRSPAARTHVV